MRLSQKVISQNVFLTSHNFLTNVAIYHLQTTIDIYANEIHRPYLEIINLIARQRRIAFDVAQRNS